MDIIYHSMLTTWNNKMIEQRFNHAKSTTKDMNDFSETNVENLMQRENKNGLSLPSRKRRIIKATKRENMMTPTQLL